mmetsp:Transcript_50570/g.99494  ORF Transcript_50570/g.99494 Transcript_50570/m.99494 type:complete len:96 (+) Transcript_50570:360-647(+)
MKYIPPEKEERKTPHGCRMELFHLLQHSTQSRKWSSAQCAVRWLVSLSAFVGVCLLGIAAIKCECASAHVCLLQGAKNGMQLLVPLRTCIRSLPH